MRPTTIARSACAVALMFTTLAACSFEADPADDPVTATLKIHDGTAVAQSGDKELSGTELEEALPKDTVVTTGEDSFVELAWSDGSVTRLDSDSSMKAGSGKDRGQLLTGKSWRRVSSEGSGNFDLTLSDGSALTTQGTGFIVDCDSSKQDCSVFLLEGKLTASGTEFSEKTWTTVSGGKAGEVNELTWSDAPGSDFGKKNSDLDGKAKNGKTLEELYKDADPALASMNGSFNGKIKITMVECLKGNCGPRKLPKKGETGDRKYAFKIECEDRLPCAGKSLTTWTEIKSGKEQTTVVPLKFDGKTYTWVLKQKFDLCVWDDSRGEGTNSNTITWKATPTKAAFVNGDFVVTEFKGTSVAKNMATKPVTSAACKPWEHSWSSDATMTAKRKR